jgi:hypothetical protein
MTFQNPRFLEKSQLSFNGGMNLMENDVGLSDVEYREAFNLINRFGSLDPVKDATEIAKELPGKKQAITSIGNLLIVFKAGQAFYKSPVDSNFQQIADFQLNPEAERLFFEFVPASTVNLKRKLSGTTNNDLNVELSSVRVSATPACLLVQDGQNRPFIIYYDPTIGKLTSRRAKNFNEWDNSESGNREYVPVGNEMVFHDGILFIVKPDRKGLMRSVTGRPLDFVINVDVGGNKPELEDDARLDYAIDFNEITAVRPLSSGENPEFLVSTSAPASYAIGINRLRTIFGEPTFIRRFLFSNNVINQFSFVNVVNGDSVFIEPSVGILSFNASLQLNVESNSSILSQKIASAFEGILQNSSFCSAINFDGYAMFSVNTKYGAGILMYDSHTESWCSFLIGSVSNVKQFTSLVPYAKELYAITNDDKVFKLFSSTNFLPSYVNTKRWISGDSRVEQNLSHCITTFSTQVLNGTITASAYVDGDFVNKTFKPLLKKNVIPEPNVSVTILNNTPIDNVKLPFVRTKIGYKIGYLLSWTGGGKLNGITHVSEKVIMEQSQNQAKQNTSA